MNPHGATLVCQEDAEGCGLAVLAMLTGHAYGDVKARVESWEHDPMEGSKDWDKHGCTHYTLDRYLGGCGCFIQRRYETWSELPMEPFAPLHYASVQQPSNRGHFVAVLADGTVLDPLRAGHYRLRDWPKVNQLVGVVRADSLLDALTMIRENNHGESWSAGVAMSALCSIEELRSRAAASADPGGTA